MSTVTRFMKRHLTLAFAFLTVGLLPKFAHSQAIVRNVTPIDWQADDVKWARDVVVHNHVDDLIDEAPCCQFFDVVVNYKRCVEDSDLTRVIDMGGIVQRRLKYITSVAVGHLTKSAIDSLVAGGNVAFVEAQCGFSSTLDVSIPNICITPASGGCPATVSGSFPAIDGTGVNIVIMDTGVDDIGHDAFNATPFIAGYDATLAVPAFVNPSADGVHGTHVASIALGQAVGTTVSRGVAPAAGLIDVKVIAAGTDCSTPGQWARIVDGLETTYDNRALWGVKVINMSFRQCTAAGSVESDGRDAFSRLVDLAESMGIVVVAAAANDYPNLFLPTPAAATRAITVAASNDNNTVSRTDDALAFYSNQGPRTSDGDTDDIDELKPEVTAPGHNITAALANSTTSRTTLSGTSMAAPHVAGLAALIIQARPGINPASVKELLISTAEQKGFPASLPLIDPIWHSRWGWGLVNGFAAVDAATTTDLTFPDYPSNPIWLSKDINTVPNNKQPKKGKPIIVEARILNAGLATAFGARIHFGAYVFTASPPTFVDIETRIVDLPPGMTPVSIIWTPEHSSHQCIKVEIGYGQDADYSNNIAQRNFDVAASPKIFQVQNTLTLEPALIEFTPTFEFPGDGWGVQITPPQIVMSADDCPADVQVTLIPPPGAQPGEKQIVHVAAKIGNTPLGGVSILDSVSCGTVRIDTVRTLNGVTVTVPIIRSDEVPPIGGFDLLVSYDASALTFLSASMGSSLDSLEWEYFTYRTGAGGNCTGGCPNGLIRLIAIADLDNGPTHHPIIGHSDSSGVLATLKFQVTGNRNFIGQCIPIRFYWADCGDNVFSSVSGDTTYLDNTISDASGNILWDEEDDVQFPESARPQGLGALDTCLVGGGPGKPLPQRRICFGNGWICINEPPDDRGDINLNGIANEVGDAVLFTNYFVYGASVWSPPYEQSQILATDINDDGIVLTVADLIYLIRIITGDARAFPPNAGTPKTSPYANSGTASYQTEAGALRVSANSSVDLGGALYVFRYSDLDVGAPILAAAASSLKIKSEAKGGELRVLVYAWDKGTRLSAGSNEIFTVPLIGAGTIELVEAQLSDASGMLLSTSMAKASVPTEYALLQNYPNPFNAGTVIPFALKKSTRWSLVIYNILGQEVRTYEGEADAGVVKVAWDGSSRNGQAMSSGTYLYRITTPEWTASKKMTLVK